MAALGILGRMSRRVTRIEIPSSLLIGLEDLSVGEVPGTVSWSRGSRKYGCLYLRRLHTEVLPQHRQRRARPVVGADEARVPRAVVVGRGRVPHAGVPVVDVHALDA